MILASPMRALTFRSEPAPALDAELMELVKRLAAGDRYALGEVYDAHHRAIRAFAGRLVGDPTMAEDLLHDVFVALPTTIQRFSGAGSLRSFLTGIAVNHARHYVRSAARRRAAAERMGLDTREQPHAPTPESQATQTAFLHAVNRALDSLPLDQRVAFVLCEVEEHSAAEAALVVGSVEATMRTRLFHARKKLRALLDQTFPEPKGSR